MSNITDTVVYEFKNKLFDKELLLNLIRNEKIAKNLINNVVISIHEKIDDFYIYFKNGDIKNLILIAHKMKGTLAQIGASKTSDLLFELGEVLKSEDIVLSRKLYKKFLIQLEELKRELIEFIK